MWTLMNNGAFFTNFTYDGKTYAEEHRWLAKKLPYLLFFS